MLILDRKSIAEAISMGEAIEAVKAAYVDCAAGNAVVPNRTTIDIPQSEGTTAILPSYMPRMGVFGAKLVSTFFDNPKLNLPVVNGVIVLQDGKTGEVLAIMDGSLPTAIKTGAATGAATDALARREARSVGLIGAGYQASRQLEAVCEVRPQIDEIRAFDIDHEKCQHFAREMKGFLSRFQARVVPVESSERAVRSADIIITVTTSTTPVFDGKWIADGTHINAVGAFMPEMQEIDETTIRKASKIVTDTREAALEMTGDLVQPIRDGIISEDAIYGEVGEILAGKKKGREREDEITIFESIGLSALDVAVAKAIYENALSRGLGRQVELG
jgi:ornithine cyclodeaminase